MNAKVQSVKHIEDGALVVFSDSQTGEVVELEADAVLLATGRRPNTKDLNLEGCREWRRMHAELISFLIYFVSS